MKFVLLFILMLALGCSQLNVSGRTSCESLNLDIVLFDNNGSADAHFLYDIPSDIIDVGNCRLLFHSGLKLIVVFDNSLTHQDVFGRKRFLAHKLDGYMRQHLHSFVLDDVCKLDWGGFFEEVAMANIFNQIDGLDYIKVIELKNYYIRKIKITTIKKDFDCSTQ